MLFAGEQSGISMDRHPKWRSLWQQVELEVVATIFVVAASSFLFLKLASEVREGETRAVDEAILLALRDPADPSNPIGPRWLEIMFRDVTSLGSPSVLALVTIAAIGYLWLENERGTALFLLVAIAGGAALEILLKLGFARPRPELVSHLVDVNSFSFPSGHATMATITYLTLRLYKQARRKAGPDVGSAEAYRLASILSVMAKCLEQSEFERRIAEMEAVIAQRNNVEPIRPKVVA